VRTGEQTSGPDRIPFGGGWSAEIYRHWEYPDDVITSWADLARSYGDFGLFLLPGWFECLSRHLLQDGQTFVVVVKHAGQTRGIFPCRLDWKPDGTVALSGLADELADVPYDFLTSTGDKRRTAALFLRAAEAAGSISSAHWTNLPARRNANVAALGRALRRRFYPVYIEERIRCPEVDLRLPSWEVYADGLRFKRSIGRARSKAEATGQLSFDVHRSMAGLDDVLTEAFRVERSSWKGGMGTAIAQDPAAEAYYRALSRWAAEQGKLYLFTLRHDGALIAFDLCLANGSTAFGMKTGYDQVRARSLSPGNLLRYEDIRYFYQAGGFLRFNFLGACHPSKRDWTPLAGRYFSVSVFSRTVRGWSGFIRRYGWKQPLKKFDALVALVRRRRLAASDDTRGWTVPERVRPADDDPRASPRP
jgi:CelD/BcsL family acetyltransferase involved in cellulose biosynthesis